ncbi:TetR/AcrR family transcriptional regulator [Streptomyces arenae]|uniref:TetR/AcrR family transcriptional regulator n=1 Tax=Streptomyces arenae TaxID=29301 RepID=UPI00265AC88C|nr:TetR/AcrR family transcriptional regulator [Streptomyces arenae]MCG7204773.1 TetR/AcrR family transcriptional regulator [Streptomyces arenae]
MDSALEPPPAPSTRGRRARGFSGDDRERAILATAERLLGERPLSEISVDQLAKGAGISRPTFYFYFTSKEQVLLALFDRVVEEARSNRGDALQRLAEDEEQGWRDAIGPFCATFSDHRAITAAAAAAQYTSPAVRELWSQVMERFVVEVTEAIESERRRRAAPDGIPARDLAAVLNSMVERSLFSTFSGQTPAVAEERLLDTLVSVFMGAIYGRAQG